MPEHDRPGGRPVSRVLRGLPAPASATADVPAGLRDDREPPPELLPGVCRDRPARGAAGYERRDPGTRVLGIWSIAYRITQRLTRLKIWP